MRRDRDQRNLFLIRPKATEDSISARRRILRVGFEDRFAFFVGIRDRVVFVGAEARMPRVIQKLLHASVHLLEQALGSGRLFPLGSLSVAQGFFCFASQATVFRFGSRSPDGLEQSNPLRLAFGQGGLFAD